MNVQNQIGKFLKAGLDASIVQVVRKLNRMSSFFKDFFFARR